MYHIPCERGSVYVGETGWNFSIRRLEEHKMNCKKVEPEKSTLAKHTR